MKPEYIKRTYGVREWTDHIDFLEQYGTKIGKLLKARPPPSRTVRHPVRCRRRIPLDTPFHPIVRRAVRLLA